MKPDTDTNTITDKDIPQDSDKTRKKNNSWQSLIVWCMIGWVLVSQLSAGMGYALHIDPSYLAHLINYLIYFGLINLWLESDSKNTHVKLLFDTGFLLLFTWPVVVPYYLFKTRDWKAILIILGFSVLFICAHFTGRFLGSFL
jgi:hypothetical protein